MIHGVSVRPLERFADERGSVLLMLGPEDGPVAQVYFSTVYAGAIKGWHRHKSKTNRYACVAGRIKLVLYDERPDSPTCGETQEIFLGPDSYQLIVIPPMVWTGFKGMTDAILCNAPDEAYLPGYERRNPHWGGIPYDWGRRDG